MNAKTLRKHSICRFCHATCPILVDIEGGRVVRVKGDPENPVYQGYSCPRGRALPEQHAHPGRLLHTQKRMQDGHYASITSERAMDEIAARVQEIIDNEINPSVAAHGGYISLLDVQDTRVFLHMGGGCQGCGMAAQTLKHGVETTLRRQIPEISEILDTTDHASGSNPYYQSGF